uniref:Putative serine proteinase inhibitor n=1 Tax=Amblyomma cajennense TaxID=34607 RepID=A0A023FRP9_AMBCJ
MQGRPLIAFATWYAFVTLMLAVLRGGDANVDTTNRTKCQTPEPPLYNLSDKCDESDILFIFNTTSGLCEDILIDPRYHNNTFKSRFECVSTCNPTQGAPFCAEGPADACNDTEECDDEWYFYNITTQCCEPYEFCGQYGEKTRDVNGYFIQELCEFQCGGFNISNVNETKTTEDAQ